MADFPPQFLRKTTFKSSVKPRRFWKGPTLIKGRNSFPLVAKLLSFRVDPITEWKQCFLKELPPMKMHTSPLNGNFLTSTKCRLWVFPEIASMSTCTYRIYVSLVNKRTICMFWFETTTTTTTTKLSYIEKWCCMLVLVISERCASPCENVSSGICGKWRPRSACAFAQQSVRMRRLIWTFTVHICPKIRLCTERHICHFCLLWLLIGKIFYSRLIGKFYLFWNIFFSRFTFIRKLWRNEIQSCLFGSF